MTGEPRSRGVCAHRVPTIHMIGNAHIDPVWLWQWPEGYQEVRATFASAIERLAEYPDFVFTHTSVLFLAWVEESDPELFARIRERIADGRWQVIGGWWIEPDCNIPSGESFVRQALYGQRYLHDRFGVVATTGGNVDSFGHNASIPQLLRRSGMDSYVFQRPGPRENERLPAPVFWWESPDGSRVLAYRIPHEYCAPRDDLAEHLRRALAEVPPDLDELMVFYGVGNHGGGPTKANLDSIRRMSERDDGLRLELSSVRRYFDAVAGEGAVPTWRGELQHHSVGCYTSHSGVKRWNRRAEQLLQRAERWSVVADALGAQPYPLAQLTEGWKQLLFNQFHDTLAGTSIAPAYEDARDELGRASSLAAQAFNRAIQSLARQIAIEPEESMRPVVVFNAHPWRVRTDVELEYAWLKAEGLRVVDDRGAPVPAQTTEPLTTMSSARGRLVFPADLPPLGFRVYRIFDGAGDAGSSVRATATTLENEHLVLELDPSTGRIARLVVKATGVDLAAPERPHAVAVDDPSDTWSHGVRAYDGAAAELDCLSVEAVEAGPVRAILRVRSSRGGSTLREDYVLGRDARHVDVRVALDWHEQLKLLKLRYPTSVATDRATFEIPYGHLDRAADGGEEPGQSWVDVSDGTRGLTVVTDAKYGYDVRGATDGVGGAGADVGVTAVRSPVWAWHDPRELDPEATYEYMDQGLQTFRLRLVPHAGDWRDAGVVRLAAELNGPPFALIESFHDGPLAQQVTYADDGGGDVVVTVLKRAEDDDAVVVRAYESSGRAAHLGLRLLDRVLDADFGPHEIKTFRVPGDPTQATTETNLLEW